MKNVFNFLTLGLLIVSCNNGEIHNSNKGSTNNHHSNHILIDSLPLKNITSDTLYFKRIILQNDTIYLDSSILMDLRNMKSNLYDYGLTKQNVLFNLNEYKKFFYKGNYGCLNNIVIMDTLLSHNCDKNFKYVILDRIAFHINHQHIRTGEIHYWKMTENEFKTTNTIIKKRHFDDWLVNLKMDISPTGGLCNSTKVFNFTDIKIDSVRNNH